MKKLFLTISLLHVMLAPAAFGVQYSRSALFPGFDGKWCKIQPSVASDGKDTALMTYQMLYLAGSDVFSGQFIAKSTDGGATWGTPVKIPESADVYERGMRVARYVNVHYSSVHRKWFATGMATMYESNRRPFHKYVDGKPYAYSVQADVDAESGTVVNYRPLPFPLACKSYHRFGQFVECEDGDFLMPIYFTPVGASDKCQPVVVRYRFGTSGLEVVEAGTPIAGDSYARGIAEPSLVKFRGKYYLTLRTDECGMWAESDDGLRFGEPVKWTWEDGTPIGNANTQQHWVPLDGRLYLAYTRVTPTNGHVFRNRAPIFIAEVDPERRCLLRETEQAVVPERGARLGNFTVAPGRGDDTWLVTAEWMQPVGCGQYGSDNSLWLVRFLSAKDSPRQTDTVVASSFGWNAEDATKCLQSALDSGARRVVVDRQASEWLVGSIMVPSNVEVVFADGVVVRAKPGSMVARTDCLFRIVGVTNVVMRGEGRAVLRMNRKDYQTMNDVYVHSEHRHLLSVCSASNVKVMNLTLEESGGDGIYILRAENVLLDGLYCRGHHRQGTSLIAGNDIRIANCTFTETKGTLPECGMDIEPGRPRVSVGRVVVDNCTFSSNRCAGVAINVGSLHAGSGRMDVTYSRCRIFDNASRGLWTVFSHGDAAPVKGSLRFVDCEIWGNGRGVLQLSNLESDSLKVSFEGCRFDASGMRGGVGPIEIYNSGVKSDLNNLSFERCELVNAPKGVAPVSFGAMTGVGVLPGGARGVMPVAYDDGSRGEFDFGTLEKKYPPQPELRKFETADAIDVKKLVPANPAGRAAKAQKVGTWRGQFSFLQYTPGPGSYPVRFVSTRNKRGTVGVQVEVFDPYGTPHDVFTVTEPDFTYQLKTRSKGAIYRFDVKPSGSLVRLSSELPGQGFVARDRAHWLSGGGQDLYFQAKPGAGDVKVELTMPPGEWVSAELYAPDGRMVDKCVKNDAGVILVGKRAADAPSEIWRMHVTRFFDDCSIRLGGATTGIYAHDSELLLIEK